MSLHWSMLMAVSGPQSKSQLLPTITAGDSSWKMTDAVSAGWSLR